MLLGGQPKWTDSRIVFYLLRGGDKEGTERDKEQHKKTKGRV